MSTSPYKRSTGYQYDGEPLLILTEDGVTIEVNAGQPVMDAGLENAYNISLLTEKGWWGNEILEPENQIGTTNFLEAITTPITKTSLVTGEKEAVRALNWAVKKKLASRIEAEITNRSGYGVDFVIKSYSPDGTIEEIRLRRDGDRWIRQLTDPAHARLKNVY